MGRALSNISEMQIIYQVAKDVYEGKYSAQYGLLFLKGKVQGTVSSWKMYFDIYARMRNGKCYKMGTSEAFTKFLLDMIYKESGEEAYKKALSSVKANYVYRESVNNSQPGLIRACKESIKDCDVYINLDEIPVANIATAEKNMNRRKAKKIAKNRNETATNNGAQNEHLKSGDYIVGMDMTVQGVNGTSDTIELNIQPAASILNVFSRLSYKPWYAIAEFVDNSTQSYISHAEELEEDPYFDKLTVTVKYDSKNNTLRITDNAYV